MARKKKNKKEQTFNVYPYLGGYQHFMRKGGSLPKFAETGTVDINTVARRIKPTNKYGYSRDIEGAIAEFKNAHQGDRINYGLQGNFLGNTAGLIKGGIDYGKDIAGVFKKENYMPGGLYSKHDADGRLRYGKINLKNTSGRNALLHGENFAKYLNMSNKEREEFIESGGRSTDLWWTPDELTHGKWNYMDLNEDGTPKFDGIMYQWSKRRNEHLVDPDTGESLFGIKTRRAGITPGDNSWLYFNPDGTIANDQSGTIYDQIESGTGTGELGDLRGTSMIFDFDKEGPNKLSGFTHHQESTTGTCSDGTSVTAEECANNGGTWTTETKTDEVLEEYDPNKNYGNWTETHTHTQTKQDKINEELKNKENNETRYGREIYNEGGSVQEDQGAFNSTAYFNPVDRFDEFNSGFDVNYRYGGSLPRFDNGNETDNPDDDESTDKLLIPGVDFDPNENINNFEIPKNDPFGTGNSLWNPNANTEINLQPEPKSDWEEPSNVQKLKNWFKGDSHLNKDPGPDYTNADDFYESIEEKNEAWNEENAHIKVANPFERGAAVKGCSDGVSPDEASCTAAGGTWTDETDMGVDVSYGDGPIQGAWNKSREFLNTGVMGAAQDVIGKTSAFLVDKVAPWIDQGLEMNKRRSNFLHKRSVSAEDVAPMMEETVGTGSRGFQQANKGGYGDDLYGTGAVYGQVQDGRELDMMQQQMPPADLSGVPNYLNLDNIGLTYQKDHLNKQKQFIGKMKYGAELPKAQGGKEGLVVKGAYATPTLLSKGKNLITGLWQGTKRWNPFAFNPVDNIFFSHGYYNNPYVKVNFNKYTGESGFDNPETIGFLNYMNQADAPSTIEMVSVLDNYRKLGLSTALYDQALTLTSQNKYPGLISGETLDNPEATVAIWKNFDKLVGNNKGQFVENPAFKGADLIKDGSYTGPDVLLRSVLKDSKLKINKDLSYFDELGKLEGNRFGFDIQRGESGYDWHSPLWRGIRSRFGKTYTIGDGQKTFSDYNKLPLIIGGIGLGTWGYRQLSGENLDDEREKKFRQEYLDRRAIEEGFDNTEDWIKHLSDTNRVMEIEMDIYNKYQDSIENDQLKIHKFGKEIPSYLRGGGTATEGAVLCDAYDQPIDPEKAWAADTVNNYKGPGMKYGGSLKRFTDKGETEVLDPKDNRITTIDDVRRDVEGYNLMDNQVTTNMPFSASDVEPGHSQISSAGVNTVDQLNQISVDTETGEETSHWDIARRNEDVYNMYNALGSSAMTVDKTWLGNLFSRGNQTELNLDNKRHAKILNERATEAGFDNVEDFLAHTGYTIDGNRVINLPNVSKSHSAFLHTTNAGDIKNTDDMVFSSTYGGFDVPSEYNKWQGHHSMSVRNEDGSMTYDVNSDAASQAFFEKFCQNNPQDEACLYANPEYRGSFLQPVTVSGNKKNGGELPKAQYGYFSSRDGKSNLDQSLKLAGTIGLASMLTRGLNTAFTNRSNYRDAYNQYVDNQGAGWYDEMCTEQGCPSWEENRLELLGGHSEPNFAWFRDQDNLFGKQNVMNKHNVLQKGDLSNAYWKNVKQGLKDGLYTGAINYGLNYLGDRTRVGRNVRNWWEDKNLPTLNVGYLSRKYGGQLPKLNDGEETSSWDLGGWLSGEQGWIPDYKGKSTTESYQENKDNIQTGLDAVSMTGIPIVSQVAGYGSAGIDVADAYSAYKSGDTDLMKAELAKAGTTAALSTVPGGNLVKGGVKAVTKATGNQIAKNIGESAITKNIVKSGIKKGTHTGIDAVANKDDNKTTIFDKVKDISTPKNKLITTEKPLSKIGEDKARFGGEQVADIDMDLYYELMKAGANIKILS